MSSASGGSAGWPERPSREAPETPARAAPRPRVVFRARPLPRPRIEWFFSPGFAAGLVGALELHSNPRRPEENRVQAYNPTFNRAVLFETNERSWHGFPRVELPPAERHRSRKSVSIYLYTRERPAGEIAPVHGTFYVQR